MKLPLKEQKIGAISLTLLTIPGLALIPSLPIALLVGGIGLVSAGFAYSLTINTAKINAELNEIQKLKAELKARYGDAVSTKKQLKELKLKQSIELDAYKNKCDSDLLDIKESLEKVS